MQKPVEKPIKFIKNLSTKGKSYPITHISAVIDDDGKSVKSTIDSLKNKSSMTKVTWLELKDKRNAGKLIPGTLYRITDYQCTTTQENTRSAGHQFDIVLLALSNNKLAEEGWAMMHENDTYFANSNLSAWKVWYCLDNDKSRFAWADDSVDEDVEENIRFNGNRMSYFRYRAGDIIYENSKLYAWKYLDDDIVYSEIEEVELNIFVYKFQPQGLSKAGIITSYTPYHKGTGPNGRGVIYRLVDEWNNDVPYDFKNIQFVRPMAGGGYDPEGEDTWVYTFTNTYDGSIKDASLLNYREDLEFSVVYAEANYINPNFDSAYFLPYNVFISDEVMSYNKLDCCINNTCLGLNNTIMYGTANKDEIESSSIYLGDKKVLTES